MPRLANAVTVRQPGAARPARLCPGLVHSSTFDRATDAEVGFEVGMLVERWHQRRRAGAVRSAAKAQASRLNGKKGGRPPERAPGRKAPMTGVA